jgi:hypothetical protein
MSLGPWSGIWMPWSFGCSKVRITMRKRLLFAVSVLLSLLAVPLLARATDGTLLDKPEAVVVKQGLSESLAMPATGYRDLSVDKDSASFIILGDPLPAGSARVREHGVTKLSWAPVADGTQVTLALDREPQSYLINAVAGTKERPETAQVIAGFIFKPDARPAHHPVVGASRPTADDARPDEHGTYELPELPRARYSDALVTLKVTNADFRDVLWLMSQIGNVSIVLDPYWADPPTGGTRVPGGGADPGAGGGGGATDPGYRPGGDFIPIVPREGTGRLSLNFIAVPFDTALELVLMSVGLVKVDITPAS